MLVGVRLQRVMDHAVFTETAWGLSAVGRDPVVEAHSGRRTFLMLCQVSSAPGTAQFQSQIACVVVFFFHVHRSHFFLPAAGTRECPTKKNTERDPGRRIIEGETNECHSRPNSETALDESFGMFLLR